MIEIQEKYLKIIKSILGKYSYTFYVYGSRVKKKARKNSDLDLCYKENIPSKVISDIKEQFEESDIPFKVDIVSWKNMNTTFQKLIEKDLKPLPNLQNKRI